MWHWECLWNECTKMSWTKSKEKGRTIRSGICKAPLVGGTREKQDMKKGHTNKHTASKFRGLELERCFTVVSGEVVASVGLSSSISSFFFFLMSSQVFRAHLDCDAAKEMTFLLSHCRPTTSPVKTVTNYYSQNKRWFSIPLGKVRGSCIEIKSLFLLLFYFLFSLFPSPSLLQWLCRAFFALKNIWCTCVKCKNRTKSRKYFGLELSPATFLEYFLNGQVSPRPQYGGRTLYILSSVC